MRKFSLFFSLILFSTSLFAVDFTVSSPQGGSKSTLEAKDGKLFISLETKDKKVLSPSPIVFNIGNEVLKWDVTSNKTNSQRANFDMPYGESSHCDYTYNELILENKHHGSRLKVRMYENLMAFKLEFVAKQGLTLKENTMIIPADPNGTYVRTNREKESPAPRGFEGEIDKVTMLAPIIYQSEGLAMAINECDLSNYGQMQIKANQEKKGFNIVLSNKLDKGNAASPWRTIIFGDNIAQLHNQKPIYQTLNPAPKGDFSWVEPKIGVWDWRNRGVKVDGFTYDLNVPSMKRFIDFCADNNLGYLLIDDGWYKLENPLVPIDGFDVKEVTRYGKSKGVGVILYYDMKYHRQKKFPAVDFDLVAKTYAGYGAKGIKYGFHTARGNQMKVKTTEDIIKTCAKYKLIVDFHDGPVPFSGKERTYPNYVSREYCHAQLDARTAFSANAFVKMACLNLLAGALDQSNGTYMLNTMKQRSKGPRNEYISTVAGENARFFITHTGTFNVLIDCPEAYNDKADLFSFIQALPSSWDESRYLDMQFDSHAAVARRKGTTWFMGVGYNDKGGEHQIKLDFLNPKKKYSAKIYKDSPKTNAKNNKEAYQIETKDVNAKTILTTTVAPSGGYSVIFTEK